MSRITSVEGEFFVAMEDSEVGVFDDHGDDFPGVCPSDPESLSRNHSDAVGGDTALDPDRARGCHLGQRAGGRSGAPDVGQFVVRADAVLVKLDETAQAACSVSVFSFNGSLIQVCSGIAGGVGLRRNRSGLAA